MTDPEALTDEDLTTSGWPGDTFDEADWDSYPIDDWADPPVEQHQPPAPPWYRNPRLLFGLIAVAAAALVVATVLLITGRESGEIPTTPQLSVRTTPTTPSERSTPPAPSESSSAPVSASDGAESAPADAEEAPAPAEPAQPAEASAAPAPAPTAVQGKSPAGPKINVTRTPMSFTPGKH
jgi:cytoskeletal protein RodZ